MFEENIRLKNIDETKKCFIEEIEQYELMSKKHKVCMALNYIEHLLILASEVGYWMCLFLLFLQMVFL